MPVLAAASDEVARTFMELGGIILVLAVLARLADRLGVSPIPLYLLVGLVVGDGGLVSLELSEEFIETASEIGVILLLLTLGLEYTAEELRGGLRSNVRGGLLDLVLNFTPGFLFALVLGWSVDAAVVLGGITYISSSGIIAKVLADLGRLGNRETPAVLSLLVIEDLVMAVYLPLVAVLLAGTAFVAGLVSLAVALTAVVVVLLVALRYGHQISRVLHSRSDEALLLSVFGLTLFVAGVAQQVQVSAAVGAFLVGIALSGPVQERSSQLIGPLRDLFAATFFLFFGLRIDPGTLPPMLGFAAVLALVTGVTKFVTARYAAGRHGVGPRGRTRAGLTFVARGEFSIVIAELGVAAAVEADLGPLAAAYVLLLGAAGPVLARFADEVSGFRKPRRTGPTARGDGPPGSPRARRSRRAQ